MSAGSYVVLGDDGEPIGTEEFRCAPGPMGWRYFSEIRRGEPKPHREVFDVAVDAEWRLARLRIDTGAHDLLVEPRADTLTGYRDRAPVDLSWGPGIHIDYPTPATNLITTKRLGRTAEIEVVSLDRVTLGDEMVRQRYELLGDEEVATPVGRFAATRWRFTALGPGWTGDLWVAGDVVVRYDGIFRLEWYEPGATGPRPLS